MLVNVYNNGQTEPKIQLTGNYLNSTAKATLSSSESLYELTSSSVTLVKVEISNFDASFKASKAKLNIKIKNVQEGGATFKLYELNSSYFTKDKASAVSLGTLLDAVVYDGKASKYQSKVADTIEFDITKYMYNKMVGSSVTLYFAIKSDSEKYKLYSFEGLAGTEVSLLMQLNTLKGLDTNYEYDQEEIGFAGVSSINLANGKMIHKVEAIQTPSEDNPAVFHMFFNKDQSSRINILGTNWTYSGDYDCNLDEEKGIIELIDPSQKTIVLNKCDEETIKEAYGLEKLIDDIEEPDYYICYSEPMYAVVNTKKTSNCIFVDKTENKMIFDNPSGFQRITKIALSNGKYIEYTYNTIGKPTQIKNSDGEYLSISYSNGYVSSVNMYKKNGTRLGKIAISYTNNRISSIKSYFGSASTVINEATYTYDTSGRLSVVSDVTAGIGSTFQYGSSSEVVKVEHMFLGDPDDQKFTEYDYFTFQTRVTDYTGMYSDYYFDYFGRCKNIIDYEAKSITRNYDEVVNGNPGNLNAESNLQINERNVIDNHSFDSADGLFDNDSSWTLESGDSSKIKIVDGGVFGQRCLRIEKNTSTKIKLKQVLKNVPKGTYTFKGFLKAIAGVGSTLSAGSINAKLTVSYKETVTTTSTDKYYNTTTETNVYTRNNVYQLKNTLSGTFDWNEFVANSVIIPGGSTISELSIVLTIELTGNNYTAYIDDLTLSYGDHVVRHNFVNNGYFENDINGWTLTDTSSSDGVKTVGNTGGHHAVLGDKALCLYSDLTKIKTVSRQLNMRGGAGDELLLNMFGKGNVTANEIFRAYIKIHYIDTDTKERFEFDFDPNFEYWQVLTRKIVADRAYDYVEIGVEVRSKSTVYIDAVQLYKDSFGKEYTYTEKKNMSEMVNSDGTCANISYDEKSNVTEATDESGDTYRYVYNSDKKVTQITNNQNTRVLFKYDDSCGKKKETKVISSAGEILKTSQSYDSQGRVSSQTDDFGVVTEFSYDSYDRQQSETSANGLVTTFKYDANNMLQEQLSALGSDKSKCTYTYDSHGNIKTITCENGAVYEFEYTINQQVTSVKVDGQVFVKNNYTKLINGVNTNLLTKQMLGSDESHGYYTFTYDDKQRLTHIYFNGSLQVHYEYDEHNRVCKLIDKCADSVEFFTYDGKGQLIAVTSEDGNAIVYDYDNLQNIQKTTLNIDGVLRSFDYEYKCEYNDYTPSGYFARLQRAFPDEIIKGGSGTNGVYGARTSLNNIECDIIDTDENTALSDVVASLPFKKINSIVSYKLSTFNKERKAESTTNKTFNYNWWNSQFRNRKTVYGWIKPSKVPSDKQRIFAFATSNDAGYRFTLTVNQNRTLTLKDIVANVEVSTSLDNNEILAYDQWNLVGFKVDFNYNSTPKTKTISIILNGKVIGRTTYTDEISMDSLQYFVLGADYSDSSTSYTTTEYSTAEVAESNMPFRLAFVSVGGTDITDEEFSGIYEEGQKYLVKDLNYGASGVTFFDESAYNGFDVITLNGSLSSLKRMQPKVHSYTEASFKVEKSRMFKFDNAGEKPLYRHVYASYNDIIGLNKGNPSKLAYDLLLRNAGTITLRFKLDEIAETGEERVILYSADGTTQKMKLYVDIFNKLCLEGPTGAINKIGSVSLDKWHFLSLRFNASGLTVNLDTLSYSSSTIINLDNTFTYIGCSVDSTEKPVEHLNGCIEMLAFKDSWATNDEITNIRDNGESFSVRTYYDELGRTSIKKIHSKDNVLSKKFTYAKKNGLTSTKISMEESYNGDTICYEYDEVGNIKNVEIEDEYGNIVNKDYTYDGLSRLKVSTINGVTNTYEYDSNNNIKKKNGVEYKYEGLLKDQLTSRTDGTVITYDTTGFIGNPLSISKPNQNLEFIWNGRRLASVRDTISAKVLYFDYNASGIRTTKEVEEEYTEKYILVGSRIAVLKRTTENTVKTLNFVYDEAQMLVGFTYNNNEYFYDRTTNGEIRHIIDKNGHVYVSYEYDDWGMPTYESDGSTIGNELLELNPFMYKGYFYDREIKMYYLKSRYYDPDLGRFINADAEVGSVGETMGMNLFAYCKCNPICYSDENGNWPSWATKLCIGLAVIAVCAIVAVACVYTGGAAACIATSMLTGAIKGALIGAVSGAISGAIMGAITEGIKTGTWEGAWKGAIQGAIEGAADGFMWGAIGGAISGAMNPKFCFVAGTLVMTKQGLKAIEDIQVGDQVLSYNDNLEIFEYKDVVEVYNNEATELCHIHTESEEIVCTPNHSVLTIDGWKNACELTTEDMIKTSTGFVQVKSIEIEQLKEKINVYNLNVLGYHTYVVGNGLLVAHNACNPNGKKGCQAHQDKIDDIATELSKNADGLEVVKEFRVDTPNGLKSRRYVDVGLVKDGKLVKGYQVGVTTKSGAPVIRERRAIKDIAEALGEEIIEFIKYR